MPNTALPWRPGLPPLITGLPSGCSVAARTRNHPKRPCARSWREAALLVPNLTIGLVINNAHTVQVLPTPSCTVPGSVPDITTLGQLSQGRILAALFSAYPLQPAAACFCQAPHLTLGLTTGPTPLVYFQARSGATVLRAIRQTPSSDVPLGQSAGRSLTKEAQDGCLPQAQSPAGKL